MLTVFMALALTLVRPDIDLACEAAYAGDEFSSAADYCERAAVAIEAQIPGLAKSQRPHALMVAATRWAQTAYACDALDDASAYMDAAEHARADITLVLVDKDARPSLRKSAGVLLQKLGPYFYVLQ